MHWSSDIGDFLAAFSRSYISTANCHGWEATVTGGLQMGGFQTEHCNIEKSASYFIWKRGISTLLESRKNKKEGPVLKVLMPHLETCGLQIRW